MKSIDIVTIIFFIIGILIKYFKCTFLIAGYNTRSNEEKENVDIDGLSKFLGNACFVIGIYFYVMNFFMEKGFEVLGLILLIGFFVLLYFVIMQCAKYDLKEKSKKNNKRFGLIVLCIMALIGISTISLSLYNIKSPTFIINSSCIRIKGSYGTKVYKKDIKSIEIKEIEINKYTKINGFNLGYNLKGDFKVEGLGKTKLYVQKIKAPSIHIKTDKENIIINFKDESTTKDLYDRLNNKMKIN